jgi:hypothetical protein
METKQPLRDLQNVTKPMTTAPLAKPDVKLENERSKPKYACHSSLVRPLRCGS